MQDDIKDTLDRIVESTAYASAEVMAFAAAIARNGESMQEAFERMAESIGDIRMFPDERTKTDISRQMFREKDKRR